MTSRTYRPVLDGVRIAAIAMVVAIHCLGDAAVASPPSAIAQLLQAFMIVAVPLFIMISGALNLGREAFAKGDAGFLEARFSRLVPATIVWSLVYGIVVNGMILGHELTADRLIPEALLGEQSPQLYFLWLIMGLYLISPFVSQVVSRSRESAFWVMFGALAFNLGIYLVPAFAPEGTPQLIASSILTYWIFYVGYYAAGHYFSVYLLSRAASFVCIAASLLMLGVVAYARVAGLPQSGFSSLIHPNYRSPLVVAASFALYAGIMSFGEGMQVSDRVRRRLRLLANSSFGVFLVHFIVLIAMRALVPALDVPNVWAGLAMWVLVLPLSWALSIGAAKVPGLRRIF